MAREHSKRQWKTMVTLGFFTFGGTRWTPHTVLPQIEPDMKVFELENLNATACHQCLQTELRCASVDGSHPARVECERLSASLRPLRLSSCEVRSFVGSSIATSGTPLRPALAACSTVCTAPGQRVFPDYGSGYSRPFVESAASEL